MALKPVTEAGNITFQFTVPAKLRDDATGLEVDVATELPNGLAKRVGADLTKLTADEISETAHKAGASVILNAFMEGWRQRQEEQLRAVAEALAAVAKVEKVV